MYIKDGGEMWIIQGLDFMSKVHVFTDIAAIVGTQYIAFGEVDRYVA